MFAHTAYASQHIAVAQGFLTKLNDAVIFPLITLMMAVALLIFLYGGFEYVKNAANEQGRETGRRHLMWGIVGMLVMLSAYAILEIAAGTFDLQNDLDRVTTPATTDPSGGNRAPTTGTSGSTGGSTNTCYNAFGDPYTCGTDPGDGTGTGGSASNGGGGSASNGGGGSASN